MRAASRQATDARQAAGYHGSGGTTGPWFHGDKA
jgi:hypothetical protein